MSLRFQEFIIISGKLSKILQRISSIKLLDILQDLFPEIKISRVDFNQNFGISFSKDSAPIFSQNFIIIYFLVPARRTRQRFGSQDIEHFLINIIL